MHGLPYRKRRRYRHGTCEKKHGRVVIVYLHGRERGADEYINVEGDSPLYLIADVTKKLNDILS